MDEFDLTQRLGALSPPELHASRERAKLAARVQLQSGQPVAPPLRRASPGGMRVALASVLVAVVVIGGGLLTPPGQAVADWVATRVGLGEPGGPPTLTNLRASWTRGTIADGVPAYVLARGPAPSGGHYEFIGFRSNRDGALCFEFDLPEMRNGGGGGCSPLPETDGFTLDSAGGNLDPDQALQSVVGRVSENVDSVKVDFSGHQVPADLVSVPQAVLDRLDIDRPFQVYVAFNDDLGTKGSLLRISVTATNEDGAEVAHRQLPPILNIDPSKSILGCNLSGLRAGPGACRKERAGQGRAGRLMIFDNRAHTARSRMHGEWESATSGRVNAP